MIIIGDIHSCAQELETIINEFRGEQILSCGDTFDRGENGVYVWELLHEYKIPAVMGNHEHKLLKFLTGQRDNLPWHYYAFLNKFAEKYPIADLVKYLQSLPYIIDLGDNHILTHGAVDLNEPYKENLSANVYGRYNPLEPVPQNPQTGWWDDYDKLNDKPFVYYGHVSFPAPNFRKQSLGLDTAACHGGYLSSFNTETNKVFQVKSKNYFQQLKQKYTLGLQPNDIVMDYVSSIKEALQNEI